MTSAARRPDQEGAAVATAARAALYLRVSTSKQAESDLSIPDQRRQIENYCLSAAERSQIHSLSRVTRPPMIADLHSRR